MFGGLRRRCKSLSSSFGRDKSSLERPDLLFGRSKPKVLFRGLLARLLQVCAKRLILTHEGFALCVCLLQGVRHDPTFVILMTKVFFGFLKADSILVKPLRGGPFRAQVRRETLRLRKSKTPLVQQERNVG